jgi:hypothetical protein
MVVVERTEHISEGTVDLTLQAFNYNRPLFIGPAGANPDYDAATAAQREYGFIGNTGSPAGVFSDGTQAYEVA